MVKMTVEEGARAGRSNPPNTIEAVEVLEGSSAVKWVDAAAAADTGTSPKAIRPAEDAPNMARGGDHYNSVAAARADPDDFAAFYIKRPGVLLFVAGA
ncbi:MAG: hypothetical protein R3D63_13355 [Paracoccaceae bacterium]